MYNKLLSFALLLGSRLAAAQYLRDLPAGFSNSSWAWVSYGSQSVAVIPGSFNRTIFQTLPEANVSDGAIAQALTQLNNTDFVAYDARFFDILGLSVEIEHVQTLAYQNHEAACYNPGTGDLLFVERGPPGGDNGTHNWQYLLNTRNNTLRKVQTDPPTYDVHGCVFYDGSFFVVTDGYAKETGKLVRIDSKTLKAETILNNIYGQPFLGLNDLDIDSDGNFWITDSKSGYGRGLVPFYYPTKTEVYFVNKTTMRPKVVYKTTGNANGIAVGRAASGNGHTIYMADTGVSKAWPMSGFFPFEDRTLRAFDTAATAEGLLTDERFLTEPMSYYYDGVRVSKNGYIFGSARSQGVDVIDSKTGLILGSIRIGGGQNEAVNIAFGDHELWIVGYGGVWHVRGVKEELARDW